MKVFLIITAIFLSTLPSLLADECADLEQKLSELICDEHDDFTLYHKCVKEQKEIRRKRQVICPLTGLPLSQVPIDPTYENRPTYVAPIIQAAPPQTVPAQVIAPQVVNPIMENQPVYVAPIYSQPAPSPPVALETPKYIVQSNPGDLVNRNVEIIGQNGTFRHTETVPAPRNITTVIKLNNYIENTNHINVPTTLNNTNINNIKIFTNGTDKYGLGSTEKGACCFAVQPKRCHTTPTGPRCNHKRHKTCGPQCTARIIHVRKGCHSRGCDISYAPQPSPKCIYTDDWPYVNCGHRRRDPCDGCYDYDPYYPPAQDCYGCYDEGFEYGQLYRRGPVMRPFYQPQPPCHITGDCEFEGDYSGDDGMDAFPSDDAEANSTEVENELGMVLHKCKVVSDDGSISIKNCTIEQDNPYASAPSYRDQGSPRRSRSYMPMPPPQMPYYYMPPPPPPMYPYGGYPYGGYYEPQPPMQPFRRQHRPKHHPHHKNDDSESKDYSPPRPIQIIDDDNFIEDN